MFKEMHDQSYVFIEMYTSKAVLIEDNPRENLIDSLFKTMKTLLEEGNESSIPNLSSALSLALCSLFYELSIVEYELTQ